MTKQLKVFEHGVRAHPNATISFATISLGANSLEEAVKKVKEFANKNKTPKRELAFELSTLCEIT